MKRVLCTLLILCLVVGMLPMTAGAVADVSTLEGFLQQLVNNGLFYDYDCETISEKEGAGITYVDAVMRVTSVPGCLDLSVYGISDKVDGSGYKSMSISKAEWLYKNIFNWSDETWEGMLAHAKSNGGYLGNKKYKMAYIKNDTLYGMEAARGDSGPSIEINTTQANGSRLEVVFTGRKQSAQGAPVSYQPYYAMVEKKTIDGKDYWTVYKTRKLSEGENPLKPVASQKPTVGGFSDVYEGDYYADPVVWAVENNITGGIGGGKFGPGQNCTRGQIVTFLWNAAGKPEPTSTENPFADVKESDYFYKAVLWAVENHITSGTGTNANGLAVFSPGSNCTRAQAVTFQWNAAGKPAPGTSSAFADVASTSYYADAVKWALEKGITSGIGGGKFGPDNKCTRGQIVTFLYNARD